VAAVVHKLRDDLTKLVCVALDHRPRSLVAPHHRDAALIQRRRAVGQSAFHEVTDVCGLLGRCRRGRKTDEVSADLGAPRDAAQDGVHQPGAGLRRLLHRSMLRPAGHAGHDVVELMRDTGG